MRTGWLRPSCQQGWVPACHGSPSRDAPRPISRNCCFCVPALTVWVVRDSGAGPSEALALPPTPRKWPSWLGPKAPTQHLSLSCGLWGSHKPPGSWPVYPVYPVRKTEAPVCLAWVPRRSSVPSCAAALSLHRSRTYGFIIPSFETGGGKWRGGPREPGFGRATCMMQRSEHLAGHVATLL